MACNKRCWALCAAYFNMFTCIPTAIFLIILLVTYSQLTDLREDYSDTFMEWYAKEMNKALMFIWVVLEITGILVCIRCVKGIYDTRTELVTQWLVWKSILTGSYFIVLLYYFTRLDLHWTWIIFPLVCFIVNFILLIVVFLYYQTMPDDDDEDY